MSCGAIAVLWLAFPFFENRMRTMMAMVMMMTMMMAMVMMTTTTMMMITRPVNHNELSVNHVFGSCCTC